MPVLIKHPYIPANVGINDNAHTVMTLLADSATLGEIVNLNASMTTNETPTLLSTSAFYFTSTPTEALSSPYSANVSVPVRQREKVCVLCAHMYVYAFNGGRYGDIVE